MGHATTATPLTPAAAAFVRRYARAFDAYLAEPGETALSTAYELGREAVVEDVALLDVCLAHHDALAAALGRAPAEADRAALARAAGHFLLEALASYEMVQRGFWEAQTTLESERRHAGMVRRLSAFLADASLAAGRPDALAETLRLVVEQGRELLDAHACRGVLRLEGQRQLSATSIASGGKLVASISPRRVLRGSRGSRAATSAGRLSAFGWCPVSSAYALTWKTKPGGVRSTQRAVFRTSGIA
jgi:hypothetical protein